MKRIVILNDDCRSASGTEEAAYSKHRFNQSYTHFIKRGRKRGLDISIAHFTDYKKGRVKSAWTFRKGRWSKIKDLDIDFVYDKFSGVTKTEKTIRDDIYKKEIDLLNHPDFTLMLKDKKKNYEIFSDFIPFSIPVGKGEIEDALKRLRNTELHKDLSTERVLLKPRYGHGGEGIIVVNGSDTLNVNGEDYILQSFLETSGGIPELGIEGRHDLRIIVVNGRPCITYVRAPKEGEVLSNENFGGRLIYFDIDEIPEKFKRIVSIVDKRLNKFHPRIYSCDMAQGKSGKVWVFEMNAKPGQVWDPRDPVDINKTKKFHDRILDVLVE